MKSIYVYFLFSIVVLLSACTFNDKHDPKQHIPMIYALSISSNGQYVISTDFAKNAVLWDLKHHQKFLLDDDANIYSAYFIKNSPYFMWQNDKTNEVIIEDTDRTIIKKLNPGFATYGQVMTSDLKYYFASDINWTFYQIYGGKKLEIKHDSGGVYAGKLANLTIKNELLLSSGFGAFADGDSLYPIKTGKKWLSGNYNKYNGVSHLRGVVGFDITTGHPIRKYLGNVAQTIANFSPDGRYIIAGDEDTQGFVWKIGSSKPILELEDLLFGIITDKTVNGKLVIKTNKKGLIPMPPDFTEYTGTSALEVIALKYIDNTHYLRFMKDVPYYTILYTTLDPKPLKYIPIAKEPEINVKSYMQNMAIDTSPSAHILVTGKAFEPGLLVFKYDPKQQVLKKIWDSET